MNRSSFLWMVVALSLASCGGAQSDAPRLAASPSALSTANPKKGLIMGDEVNQVSADHFASSVSWFYNYEPRLPDWQLAWANANHVEFVPMILRDSVELLSGGKCYFPVDPNANPPVQQLTPVCTLQDVIAVLNDTRSKLTTPPAYFLGFNEQFNKEPNDMTPPVAADNWRWYIQPAAQAVGLKLVSPTGATTPDGISWLGKFIKRCYDKRTDPAFPCDVEKITRFAVHRYDCQESSWETNYGANGYFRSALRAELGTYGGYDWATYVNARQIWVTETNCFWESPDAHPDSKAQCLRITGRMSATHGIGSINKMDQLATIERYSWWTLWNSKLKPNYLTYQTGQLTPAGRGYLSPTPSTDCEYPGWRLEAESAQRSSDTTLTSCPTASGGALVSSLGPGTVTFRVFVPAPGVYSLNVSYLSAVDRDLTISVNGQGQRTVTFPASGKWCYEGGAPTVLPVTLKFTQDGFSSVTFGNANGAAPSLDWISVVTGS